MEDLKNALKTRENRSNEIISMEHLDFSNEIFKGEIGTYLKQKSFEIAVINTKGALALGKVFNEVFEKFGNQNSGTYEKWIELSGYNKRTALRYRKKFELFNLVEGSKKQEIVMYSFELIEKIFQENIEEIVQMINDGMKKQELMEFLTKPKEEEKIALVTEFKVEDYKGIFNNIENFETKIKSLDSKKQSELKKYLEKIMEILK